MARLNCKARQGWVADLVLKISSDPDPVFKMRSDPDLIFKIRSDPDPVWASRLKTPLKSKFNLVEQNRNILLTYQLY